ncbi:acyltransferase family protein [Microbacterium sp. CIAB417]|uniref:acyltransferase family protein n=1 Tax=Microbacterium sp. CIAB417 TaxID=2860287 RepID=UPI001FAD70CF|nr:acyltransferase family protein [Microbacterium sp. CIAB417]
MSATTVKRRVRTDIQALRAIAVVLVILDHLVLIQRLPGSPQGGFIGVDVFFVISGFLITQHLVSEVSATGRVSFKEFYIRRARRILPMALLVIAVTALASFAVFWPWQASNFALDGLWSALFVSNIAFALRGVDYFSADQTSIFQHYWSLSVEEQFYLVWPVLIAIVAGATFAKGRVRIALISAASLVALASFLWSCFDTSQSPAAAYFSTFARGFEFALGGLLAMVAPRLAALPSALRPILSAAGLIIIGVSVYVIDPAVGFPGPMALLPTAGALLFIAAGTATDRAVEIWPLRTRPVTYIGNISYSLYLWHWPIIMVLSALVPRDVIVIPAALFLTFALAAISYRFVEQPILRSSWLRGTSPKLGRPTIVRNVAVMSIGVVTAAALVAGGDTAVRALTSGHASTSETAVHLTLQEPQPAEAQALVGQLQADIQEGETRQSWAGLTPAVSDIGTYAGALASECWTNAEDEPRSCLRGDPNAAHTIVVFGDSIAMNAAFAVDAFVEQHPDWNLRVFAKLGCAAQDVPAVAPNGAPYDSCVEFRSWALDQINSIKPDAVWLTSALPRELPGIEPSRVVSAWQAGLESTLDQIADPGKVFVVMPPPAGEDLAFCSRPYNTPQDCGSTITGRWISVRDTSSDVSSQLGAVFVDTALWYCDEDGRCPAVIGDYIVRRDERHLTYDFGSSLAPLVSAWVTSRKAG